MLQVNRYPHANSKDSHTVSVELPLLQNLSFSRALGTSLVALAGYLTFKCLKTAFDRHRKGYPNGPMALIPFLGSSYKMFDINFMITTCGLYGALTYLSGFGRHMIIINESKIAKHVLFNQKKFSERMKYIVSPDVIPIFEECGAQCEADLSFGVHNGEEWKRRRQYAMSVLVRQCDSRVMSDIIHDVMHNVVFKQLDSISDQNGSFWDPKPLMSYLAFNTIYHANFGHSLDICDPKCLEMRQLMKERFAMTRWTRYPILLPSILPLFKKLPIWSRMLEIDRTKHRFFTNILAERREYYKQNPLQLEELKKCVEGKKTSDEFSAYYVDYLLYLLDYAEENQFDGKKKSLNEYQAMNDLSIMFGAGTDTTSSSLEYIIYLMMKRPDVQEEVSADLRRVVCEELGAQNGLQKELARSRFGVATFLKSVIFKAFVHECLRIATIAPRGVQHTCRTEEKVSWKDDLGREQECVIPADSVIVLNIANIHLGQSGKENWKNQQLKLDMDDICLDNWIVNDANGKKKFKMNESYLNFGTGSRDCVGQQVAMKEIYLILGYLMLNYKFEAKDGNTQFEIERRDGLTVEVANDIPVVVTKRGLK